MKKLLTLTLVFLFGIGFSNAENNSRYRNYTNNFIFNQNGIEFAVFPDGQFDFNYLQGRNGTNLNVNTGNLQVSFNTGYNYNRFVQYDSYGAVIQIEETPVFYDSYGRVNQIGDVFINYRGGYINRIGNMNVFYSRPGVIDYYSGYINVYNRNYIYQPWHNYYSVPLLNRCIVYTTPYRLSYFPLRYAWSYHRNYWNTPSYYNGYYARSNVRRDFYRPYDRVNYRSFERGQRDARGRAVAVNSRVSRNRQAIATGRSQVTRNNNRSTAATYRTSERNTTAASTRSSSRNGINREAVNNRSDRSISATARNTRSTSRSATLNAGDKRTKHSATTRANRNTNAKVGNRMNRTERAVTRDSRINSREEVTRSTRHTTPRRSKATTRSSDRNNTAVKSKNATSRNTQARSSRTSSNRNANRSSGSKRSHKRG
jgi:hypothetical protein